MKQTILATLLMFTVSAFAEISEPVAAGDRFNNTQNCKDSKWTDENGQPISIEEKFGPGTMKVTRCLRNNYRAKVVYQINAKCKDANCTAPYAIGNIQNQINDYKITHKMGLKNYRIVVVVHAGGWQLVLNNNADNKHGADNPFQAAVEKLVNTPGVKVLFCQNTAAKKGVVLENMIDGIGFVTAGVTAITDLQDLGYRYVQP